MKKLFNLRYLIISRTLIKELPSSIGRLQNLHTLDLKGSKIEVLPNEVGKLKNLCHLVMYRFKDYEERVKLKFLFPVKAPKNISKLKNFQVLYCVNAEGDIIKQLGNMTQLARICVANVKQQDGKDLCELVQKMICLGHVFVMASDEEEILEMQALNSTPPRMKKVILAGKLERVPPWLCSLQNMSLLHLQWMRLTQDLLLHIAALPCLTSMYLINACIAEKLCFREGFTKLENLALCNMQEWSEIAIEKGVMSDVSSIQLDNFISDISNCE